MRRWTGAMVAALALVAGVLAAPASGSSLTVGIFVTNPGPPDNTGVLLAYVEGADGCSSVTYDWDLDADGTWDLVDQSSNLTPWAASQWSSGPGTYPVLVRANACGQSATGSATVIVPGATTGFSASLTPALATTVGQPVSLILTIQNQPPGSDLSFAWDLDGDGDFDDSTEGHAIFTPVAPGTFGVQVRVRHSAMADGEPGVVASTLITVTPGVAVSVSSPTLTGVARAGQTLTAGITATPSGTVPTWTWLRDGRPVAAPSTATYRLTRADAGCRVAVRVGGTHPTYGTAAPVTSGFVNVAALNLTRPSVTGTARVGRKLTARRGTWQAPRHTYAYQWLRNGTAVRGATRSTYTTTKADRGRRISVRVTARRSGFPAVKAVSPARSIAR